MMKILLMAGSLCVLLFSGCLDDGEAAVGPQPKMGRDYGTHTCAIAGLSVNREGAGVSGVTVMLLREDTKLADVLTDTEGSFIFRKMTPDNYSLKPIHDGHYGPRVGVDCMRGEAASGIRLDDPAA